MGPLACLARWAVRNRNTLTVSISTRREATAAVISRTHPLVVLYQEEPSVDTKDQVHTVKSTHLSGERWYC